MTKKKKNLREPIVALTGAGISAESGIPTFRGEEGLWRQYRSFDLATPEAFIKDPHLVWQFYDWRRQVIASCEPNPAHLVLVEIEQTSTNFQIITQNVDGLHTKAGNRHVIEIHGSIWTLECQACGKSWNDDQAPLPELPPKCPSCTSFARPGVVWFGEVLDRMILNRAELAAMTTGTLLVVGTSSLVHPANLLALMARDAGAHVIEFNLEPTPLSPHVDECHFGPAGKTLPLWWKENS